MRICTTRNIRIAMVRGTGMPVCTTSGIWIAMGGGIGMGIGKTGMGGLHHEGDRDRDSEGTALVGGIVQESPVLPLVKKYFINTIQLYLWREQA